MSSITTNGAQAFNVPNNDEGQTFLRLMRKFINRPRWRFRGLGRGNRNRNWSVSQAQAEWIAVYLGGSNSGGQFKAASLLSLQEDNQLWLLQHGGAKLLFKNQQATPLTEEEKGYLQLILETYEELVLLSPSPKESDLFYGVFQKLIDI